MASKNYNINSNLYVNDGKIVGGYNNNLTGGTYSTILGGQNNTTDNNWSSIIGGKGNIQSGTNNFNTFIGVGYQNTISHPGGFSINYNSIINGRDNHISTTGLTSFSFNTIVGGRQNSSLGVWGFVGGGAANYLGINGYRFSGGIFPPDPTRNEYGSFIGGGITNRVYGSFNSVVGGRFNTISQRDLYTNIGGGRNNSIYTYDAYGVTDTSRWGTNQFIGGGFSNGIYGRTGIFFNLDRLSRESLIVGGNNNYITSSERAFIGGGINNQMTYSDYSLVVGGFNNDIYAAFYSSVVGGNDNYVRSSYASSIVGGRGNQIDSDGFLSQHQFIGGGRDNKLLGNTSGNLSDYSSIVGGQANEMTATTHSVIGGGQLNKIQNGSNHSFIGGGIINTIVNSAYSTIAGGNDNSITDNNGTVAYGFIGGGGFNSINSNSYFGTIAGGFENIISSSYYSTVGGGFRNVLNSGSHYSSILGGQNNTVNQNNSHIIGSNITSISANTTHVERFNIGTVDTGSTATEVLVRETNGMVNTVSLTSFTQQKYAANIPFTAATSQTVTHNLNDTDVLVQLKDSTGTLVIPDVVDNYTNNTVDIKVSSTETFRVIIIG